VVRVTLGKVRKWKLLYRQNVGNHYGPGKANQHCVSLAQKRSKDADESWEIEYSGVHEESVGKQLRSPASNHAKLNFNKTSQLYEQIWKNMRQILFESRKEFVKLHYCLFEQTHSWLNEYLKGFTLNFNEWSSKLALSSEFFKF